ncbi:MAG TPA: hypothetical protein VK192_09170 [Sphingomicrobium sp.]|nr:hypothetical protein [Sphingomicrobium sp.]
MNQIDRCRHTAEAHTTSGIAVCLLLFVVIFAATVSLALPAVVLAEQSIEIVSAADGRTAWGWVAVLAVLMTLSFLLMLTFATRVLIACWVWRPGSALSTSASQTQLSRTYADAPWEQPEILVSDPRAAFRSLR